MMISGRRGDIGPLYAGEWSNLSQGTEERSLRAVAIDPLNPKRILIGSERGVFLSSDGGKVWTNVLDLSSERFKIGADLTPEQKTLIESMKMPDEVDVVSGCTAIAIDPANSQKIIVGSVGGLYTSEDGGRSWNKADGALQAMSPCVLSVAIDPSNPDMIYAGTLGNDLLKSSDGGKSWNPVQVTPETKTVASIAVHPFDSNVIYAGTTNAVFKTTDAGATWKKLEQKPEIAESLAVDQVNPDNVYMGTSKGLYKSTDGGKTWMGIGDEVFGGGLVRAVAVSPSDSNAVYAATPKGVFGSPDRGASWQNLSEGVGIKDAMALAFDPLDSSVIWTATASGLYKTAVAKGASSATAAAAPAPAPTVPVEAPPQAAAQPVAQEVVPEITLPSQEEEVETLNLGGGAEEETVPAAGAEAAPAAAEKQPEGPPIPTIDDVRTILGQFSSEPSVQEIQEVAMRFAEVHPDLIEGWRKGAKWRALLPKFKLTIDTDRRKETSFTDKFEDRTTTDSGEASDIENGVVINDLTGTEITQLTKFETSSGTERRITTSEQDEGLRRRDRDIKLEFTWDLGDFLYNPDQVRISDETRDLVELRNDVLEEVTQFYFQRRQLQIDLLLSPPEDLRERLRMELQLQEVTANIDYLTGGYLTQRLNDVKQGVTRKSGMLRRLFNI